MTELFYFDPTEEEPDDLWDALSKGAGALSEWYKAQFVFTHTFTPSFPIYSTGTYYPYARAEPEKSTFTHQDLPFASPRSGGCAGLRRPVNSTTDGRVLAGQMPALPTPEPGRSWRKSALKIPIRGP